MIFTSSATDKAAYKSNHNYLRRKETVVCTRFQFINPTYKKQLRQPCVMAFCEVLDY